MFRRNIIRSGCVCDTGTVAVSELPIPDHSKLVRYKENKITFDQAIESTFNFQIINMFGQVVIDQKKTATK